MSETSETSVPGAAVQIAQGVLDADPYYDSDAPAIVFALHQHGWLHDPAEVAALRDAIEQVRNLHGGPHRCPGHLMHDVGPCRTLAALPPTGGAR
jgi:hypothetical protein